MALAAEKHFILAFEREGEKRKKGSVKRAAAAKNARLQPGFGGGVPIFPSRTFSKKNSYLNPSISAQNYRAKGGEKEMLQYAP